MQIYQVGGAVRDELLGRAVSDRDWLVVGATAADLEALGYRRVGADFPVFLHPESHEEYALARTERKSGHGYRGFITDASAAVTLEEDLLRRDFTINAMARGADGTLHDPYGGRTDLEAGILRHVSPAFSEDPLRVVRGARFAAQLGFNIADETLELMRQVSASGELEHLAPERVWTELRRALNTEQPQTFIRMLRDAGALKVLLPEIDRLFGVPQPPRYHPEIDTGEHILLALAQAARREAVEPVRFAVLVHDLGKGTTPADILPSHRGHEERGVELIGALSQRLRVPREHRELAQIVSGLHTRVHRCMEMKKASVVRLLEQADAYRRAERFEQFLEACVIDATGRKGLSDTDYPQADYLREARALTASIDVAPLAARGLAGSALKDAIHAARIEALKRSES